jgi:hypothetical protein
MQSPFDPFWLFRFPLSGNVAQRFFSPALTVNYAGNAAIEERVAADVASNGKQLGWLSELVRDLANKRPPNARTLQQLTNAVAEIEEIKRRHGQSTLDGANAALDLLQEEQAEAYQRLLDDRTQRLAPPRASA